MGTSENCLSGFQFSEVLFEIAFPSDGSQRQMALVRIIDQLLAFVKISMD